MLGKDGDIVHVASEDMEQHNGDDDDVKEEDQQSESSDSESDVEV